MTIYPNMTGERIITLIKSIIDDRLDGSLSDSEASQKIEEVLYTRENRLKIRKDGKYTSTFKGRMGLHRMEIFRRLYDK